MAASSRSLIKAYHNDNDQTRKGNRKDLERIGGNRYEDVSRSFPLC